MTHFWQIFCQYYYPEITWKLPEPGFTKNVSTRTWPGLGVLVPGRNPDPVILDSFTQTWDTVNFDAYFIKHKT